MKKLVKNDTPLFIQYFKSHFQNDSFCYTQEDIQNQILKYPSWFCELIKGRTDSEEYGWVFSTGEWVQAILEISLQVHYQNYKSHYLMNSKKAGFKFVKQLNFKQELKAAFESSKVDVFINSLIATKHNFSQFDNIFQTQ